MIRAVAHPITSREQNRLFEWARVLIGRYIVGVRYRSAPGSSWCDGDSVKTVHEVDMDVTILLNDEASAVVSWAMDGLVEGIDLRMQGSGGMELEIDEIDVEGTPEWRNLVGRVIEEVAVSWHVPNEGCPEAIWAVRLSVGKGRSVTVALGEVEAGVVRYQPDALVVLFGESEARSYLPPASTQTAFGTAVVRADPTRDNLRKR